MKKLTALQLAFIDEYLIDRNGTQAAIRAGYSKNTAAVKASQLLADSEVKQKIDEGLEALKQRNLVDQDRVVSGLLKEAESYGEGTSHSARVQAWSQLGKHLGMFKEQVEVSVNPVELLLKQLGGNTIKPKDE